MTPRELELELLLELEVELLRELELELLRELELELLLELELELELLDEELCLVRPFCATSTKVFPT